MSFISDETVFHESYFSPSILPIIGRRRFVKSEFTEEILRKEKYDRLAKPNSGPLQNIHK